VDALLSPFDPALGDPIRRGKYLHALGRYTEAADAFATARGVAELERDVWGEVRPGGRHGVAESEAWAVFDRGKALRAAGQPEEAAALLEEAAARLPASPWPAVEWALALAALGQFTVARARLEHAHRLDPGNPWVGFVLGRSAARHLDRSAHYARQGQHDLAVRDREAALIADPLNTAAQVERAVSLAELGGARAAREILAECVSRPSDPAAGIAGVALARLHLALGEHGAAKVALERTRRQHPHDPAVAAGLAELHEALAAAQPLPLARAIVEASGRIPGWFGADEAELLVALTLRAVAPAAGPPPVLVEIGSYCGRATVALGLALRGLGRTDARIISVDEPGLGPAPDGRPARAALRANLAAHGLADLVIFAPEDEPAPWQRVSHLLLIDGRHDDAGVREDVDRYAPSLAPGGLLLFHDYADYFPDVQRRVDELLVDPAFELVAQASSLIALVRRDGAQGQRI
jgi:tetratricopeptide (TPR) repeat protein